MDSNEPPRFIDNGDGTITDTVTTLMWMKEDSFNILKKFLSYGDAVKFLNKINTENYCGHGDWRFPDKHEAYSLFIKESAIRDKYDMDIHIHPVFSERGGFNTWTCHTRGKMTAYSFSFASGTGGHKEWEDNINDSVRFVRGVLDKSRYKITPVPQAKDMITKGGGWR
ncbi:MAG: hypothetical protein COV67_05360 [Nitrospinae bacterium CG11_big_fil_rev_8_21_14_0_20_56_8]|nr:MAG: hypothetical protein COV67_05360 [Nitrospinae bacterium CG11_big_fil_rev_8_21_14_0_20_56_8]